MKIEQIKMHNFKGIADMTVSLSEVSAIIFGGKNGYGKTTIFDALELVLTGEIERYRNYKEKLFDHRRNPNKTEMPLVCNQSVPDVSISIMVSYCDETGSQEATLMRKAKVSEMENPINFNVFQQLYISKNGEEYREITTEESTVIGLDKFAETYGTLGYLSQEESTLFIKSSDSDRVDAIQYLFNTKRFDERIEKIEYLILKGIKRYSDELKAEQRNIEKRIEDLKKNRIEQQEKESEYLPLFKEGSQVKWDIPDAELSNEEYFNLLKENGVIDGLLYLADKKENLRKYRKDKSLEKIADDIADFAHYWQFRSRQPLIKQWCRFQNKVLLPFDKMELKSVEQYTLNIPQGFEHIISDEVRGAATKTIELVKSLYRSASLAEQAYNEMLDQRNRLEDHLRSHAELLSQTECPLCGNSYENVSQLLETLAHTARSQQESTRVFSTLASQEFIKMKDLLMQTIINPTMAWFEGQGINSEVVERFLSLDTNRLEPLLLMMIEKGFINETPEGTLEESEAILRKAIEENREPYDGTLNYEWLTEIYNNYGKLMTDGGCEVNVIMKKRAHLLQRWAMQQSQLMKQLLKELQVSKEKSQVCDKKKSELISLKKEIEKKKNQWLKKVITDVEILFYIYSGRIMQDNFFGRGLFMKAAPGKYIYFVSSPQSEVDALYKLSSGQLVALMMSLLLSLNKLYATEKIIAIDDPVQTIDDINVWGFVETLRHEFRDYQLLFSTHEHSYGSFLRYKLSKMGILTEYRDMLEERMKGSD